MTTTKRESNKRAFNESETHHREITLVTCADVENVCKIRGTHRYDTLIS